MRHGETRAFLLWAPCTTLLPRAVAQERATPPLATSLIPYTVKPAGYCETRGKISLDYLSVKSVSFVTARHASAIRSAARSRSSSETISFGECM
jgi:hypothetical protein